MGISELRLFGWGERPVMAVVSTVTNRRFPQKCAAWSIVSVPLSCGKTEAFWLGLIEHNSYKSWALNTMFRQYIFLIWLWNEMQCSFWVTNLYSCAMDSTTGVVFESDFYFIASIGLIVVVLVVVVMVMVMLHFKWTQSYYLNSDLVYIKLFCQNFWISHRLYL